MPYSPSFTEIFLGYVVLLFWSAWLGRKGQLPSLQQWMPFGVGLALLAAQGVATWAVMHASANAPDPTWVEGARWASVAVVALGLVLEGALTARQLQSPAAPPSPPPPTAG